MPIRQRGSVNQALRRSLSAKRNCQLVELGFANAKLA